MCLDPLFFQNGGIAGNLLKNILKLPLLYYAPSGSTKFADTNSWLDNIGIVEAGTKVDQWGYPKNFFAKGENATGDVAVWNKHTITFTAKKRID